MVTENGHMVNELISVPEDWKADTSFALNYDPQPRSLRKLTFFLYFLS